MRVSDGSPHKLGATWDGRGTNFALFSANAEKVELCLFDRQGRRELERIALPERTDDIWHGYLHDVLPGQLYGYRVHGQYAPEQGHRFNANKLLIDPYAKRLFGRIVWSDAHFGYRAGSSRQDLSFDRRDNARGMPKAMVIDEAFTWGDDPTPADPWHDTIVYEAHVKGVTMLREDVPSGWRGLFSGLTAPGMIDHLKRLGVTSIELLPVHAFVDDRHLVEKGLKNYWGYNSIGFFAPEPRYSIDGSIDPFKTMVSRLHAAGIEVILDVVYNHTAEGNHLGPTLSFKGIDNASYYWLMPGDARHYDNFTGTGNALKLTHPRVLQMVMDSLRYWVEACHVNGFRFDLATTLGRGPNGFDPNSAFFAAVRQDPVLGRVKLIAEPWDIGMGGYQVGNFPSEWSEWNDAYRKTLRCFWRGDAGQLPELGRRLTASADIYRHRGRAPRASVNHVTVHDGFTLADLVSYENKHNEANGEDNRDGSDENFSINCGIEGPTDDPAIVEHRRKLRHAQLACLILAQGVPLMLAGDEVGNSQGGNNNTYCQDSEIGWTDWSGLGQEGEDLTDFIGKLTALRRRYVQLKPRHWFKGQLPDGSHDIVWLTPASSEMAEKDWNFAEGRFLSYVLAPVEGSPGALFIVLNAADKEIEFTLPKYRQVQEWQCEVATVPLGLGNVEKARGKRKGEGAGIVGDSVLGGDMSAAPRFGPRLEPDGGVTFRLWAPAAKRVELMLDAPLPMLETGDGWYERRVDAAGAGMRYHFRIDGELEVPDPGSHFQPEDVQRPSEVVDHRYDWQCVDWKGRPWRDAVVLELHVGTFTPQGSFRGVIDQLDHLVETGITAIELMPLADFAGRWNWGYDGVLLYAPDSVYGRPEDLKALIDAAHACGLMVFLDVVYNHFGPEGNYLARYAPQFFTSHHKTPWGDAIDYRVPEVRSFAIENALHWLDNYRFDGLRLDAVHAIAEPGEPHILNDLSRAVGELASATGRHIHLVLENDDNRASLLDPKAKTPRGKYRGQWNDDYHHAWHVLLTGETGGYYGDYAQRPADAIARAAATGFVYQGETSAHRGGAPRGEPTAPLSPAAFVNFLQNHDQVGNRAYGDRLEALAPAQAIAAALAVTLLAPSPPLLFMGEEWGTTQPFPFFCDFKGDLAEAVRRGRRAEFEAAFANIEDVETIPDPLAETTVRSATLDWKQLTVEPHASRLTLVRTLLAARREHIVPLLDEIGPGSGSAQVRDGVLQAAWRCQDGRALKLLANLTGLNAAAGLSPKVETMIWGEELGDSLPPWSARWWLERA